MNFYGGVKLTRTKTNLNNEELLYSFDSPIYTHEESKSSYVMRISKLEELKNDQYVAMRTAED